ncbi:YlbF family regulator [Staphylococcus equorum]|uniref:YlbF family regulator n=1 Tax=Staphylococcus equorum TaxID=246432 RepID=A0A9X4L2D6_9STAP|nr:YlbF family regulator [Staphylococcus equorum]MDG0818877.1 YlbF family regulator [Staphylococcus equorum]MDG0839518.1 YlbF family regulator [Staphylococcus equorum]MDG0844756.1 YlbF family regulator [Staphylococcus equorum]
MYEKDDILAEANRISERIKSLDTVKDYHTVEQQIHYNKNIEQRMKDLKKTQKQSVNLQNYGKTEALKQSEGKIQGIEQDINVLPIVEEFRESQTEANDLLQMMISTMSDRLNQHEQNEG